MKITTKSRYAIRALYSLVVLGGAKKSVALTEISKHEMISRKYLEQIFIQLKKNKIVRGSRGASGGYMLIKDPSEITLKDVIYIMDGPVTPVICTENDTCEKYSSCTINWLWIDLKNMVDKYLEDITLEALVSKSRPGELDAYLS